MLNRFDSLYRAPDWQAPTTGRYNDEIAALMLAYVNRRNVLSALAAPCAALVKALVNAFLMKTDATYNLYLRYDGLPRQYTAPLPGSGLFDFDKADVVVAENLDFAQREIDANLQAAREMLPQLENTIYLSQLAEDPGRLFGQLAGDVAQIREDYLRGLEAASDKQAQALRLVDIAVTDRLGAYVLLNGPMDTAMQALNIDLVAVHRRYVQRVMESGSNPERNSLLASTVSATVAIASAFDNGQFTACIQEAQAAATATLAQARADVKAARADLLQRLSAPRPVSTQQQFFH